MVYIDIFNKVNPYRLQKKLSPKAKHLNPVGLRTFKDSISCKCGDVNLMDSCNECWA